MTAVAPAFTITSTVLGDNLTVTRTDPPSTVTVFGQFSSAAVSATTQAVIANSGFENDTSNPFNSLTTTGLEISATVVQAGPLWHETGSNYL